MLEYNIFKSLIWDGDNMDSRVLSKEHKLSIIDRQITQVTGIDKVISIDEQQISLITDKGKLIIVGRELHAGKLDVAAGVLEFTGVVNSITYTDYKTPGQRASGFVGRLFK